MREPEDGGITMNIARRLLVIFVLTLFLRVPGLLASQAAQPEIKVWATDSGNQKTYHCPRSRWYGVGNGKEIGECQAIRQGYRPAVGDGCGSTCQ